MEKSVNLSQLTNIRNYVSEFSNLDADYVFSRLTPESHLLKGSIGPVRIKGLIFFFVRSGHAKVDINLSPYDLTPNTLLIASSTSIIDVKEIEWDNLDAYSLIISPEFMSDINFDLNVISNSKVPVSINSKPILKMTEEESNLLFRYFDLLHTNTIDNVNDIYKRSISRCIIAAMAYQLLQFVSIRITNDDEVAPAFNRRSGYVRNFMALVQENHRKERSVSFYAERLFISTKYLSLIIKESTGKSAAEWIDEFVILEAKNLLRFSHKNIQQIAYELNFPNQSSFGKYFKNLTGMSPSAYQKSK